MSLITCCPACGTMFRVVPDQLKISEGWVRCGHCAEVFDATAHMAAPVPAPAPAPASASAQTQPSPPPPQSPSPLDADTLPPAGADNLIARAPAATPAPTPPPAVILPVRESEAPDSELDQPFVFRRSDLMTGDSLPSVAPPVALVSSRPAPLEMDSSFEPDHDAPAVDVSFMRQARRDAFWRRPFVRAMLVLLIAILGALLALQSMVHDRDRLAATHPDLRPWIERACDVLRCRIEAPRQIETLAIDSSTFNKLRSDAYRLSFTLKNNAATPVATPAMELTLTDGQDQPVVRRVLMPADLGTPPATLASGGDWSTAVTLTVNQSAQTARIAGYRLLAFYP